jgi:1-acyl-sn-glycerol-3-phosphate acyltransferase
MQALGSLLFTLFMIAWTLFYAILFVLVGGLMSLPKRFGFIAFYAHCMLGGLRLLCRLDYTVEGLQNIPDEPHVALWKHSSAWETFAQFLLGPPKVLVLKRELMWIPFFGMGLALLHSIAIDRRAGASAVNQVVDRGRTRLAEGLSVLIFPEGTRQAPGTPIEFKRGVELLYSKLNAPLLPVAMNSGLFWLPGNQTKRAGVIRVSILPSVPAGQKPQEAIKAAEQEVQAALDKIA